MKSTIIYLGVLALAFTTNSKAATRFNLETVNQQEITSVSSEKKATDNRFQLETIKNVIAKDTNSIGQDTENFVAIANFNANYERPIEEVIAENKLIIEDESEDDELLTASKSMDRIIAEDEQIIQNTISNIGYPLDFEKINNAKPIIKTTTKSNAVMVELKL